jgi:hypothetical protein
MKFLFVIISLVLCVINSQKKEIDIKEDFTADVDYRLEKSGSTWKKRGNLNFVQRNNNKNYKPSVNFVNEQFSNEQIEEIKSECKNGNGLYFLRIKTGNNLFFSSVKSCDLLKNNLHDRFIINSFGQIRSDSILSINYDVDNKYLLERLNDEKLNFFTSVEFVDNIQSVGPVFPEEKEAAKGPAAPENQSFLSKYWWIILIVVVMMMVRGPEQEGASQ